MKRYCTILLMGVALSCFAQDEDLTVKSVLLDQLTRTHNVQDWFVPATNALQGLTPEQVMWKPNDESHSVGQLATHLIFWNSRILQQMRGERPEKFSGDNEKTFSEHFTEESWAAALKQLEEVFTGIEQAIRGMSDEELKKWYPTISNMNIHNAYHTGQILYARKLQGSWNPENGVK